KKGRHPEEGTEGEEVEVEAEERVTSEGGEAEVEAKNEVADLPTMTETDLNIGAADMSQVAVTTTGGHIAAIETITADTAVVNTISKRVPVQG
ncbi:hypothetical protein, partial [Salmonella sp. s51944]|uniref:hypothetical protein n=1 Tax=Salmonella sp. s51944 TaxID=3159655 RepID=UPI00397F47B5